MLPYGIADMRAGTGTSTHLSQSPFEGGVHVASVEGLDLQGTQTCAGWKRVMHAGCESTVLQYRCT
jgi:hypothetical protein